MTPGDLLQNLERRCDGWLWKMYESAPQAMLDMAGGALRYALPLLRYDVPITIYQRNDPHDGRSPIVVAAGNNPWISDLARRFFGADPKATTAGRCPAWMLPIVLRQYESSADLIIARVDRLLSRLAFGKDYLPVPEWVGTEIRIPPDPSTLFKNESVRTDLRRIKKNGLSARLSYDEADFERFYYEFHAPFVTRRHGGLVHLRNIHRLRRIFRRGALLWIERGGRPVAGTVLERRPGMIRMIVLGMKGDDAQLMRDGVPSASYYFSIQLAHRERSPILELGGVRPVLNDGVLQFKRKWSAILVDKKDIYHDYMVRFMPHSPSVLRFLSRTPLIYQDRVGLGAMAALPPAPSPNMPLGYAVCPGLRHLTVLGGADAAGAIAASLPAGTKLVAR